jgi:tellurite resistance protein TehA-like permease
MGFVTICTAIANYGIGYNLSTVMTASVFYWVSMVLSLFSICVVPFYMMTRHQHRKEGLTAIWLLPFGA